MLSLGPWKWITAAGKRGGTTLTSGQGWPVLTLSRTAYDRVNAEDLRLIAAAPELYAELKHLVELMSPMEEKGALNIRGLATLNGARRVLNLVEGK